jgi:2-polyprenyl-3-methyl-5-hydroxy-6-metoxy-1,4-benzoquinol methylase
MTDAEYDKIGGRYDDSVYLHTAILQRAAILTHVGNVQGHDILDLGCGTGLYSRKFIEAGASKLVAIDISEAMVESARRQTMYNGVSEFYVADASKPLHLGQFDLVLAAWILNYASNEVELLSMWSNIFKSLKPGGRCVGIVPDLNQLQTEENPQFGQSSKPLSRVQGGVRVRTTLHAPTPISFNHYIMDLTVHEKCAREAGFPGIHWMTPVDPQIPDLAFASFVEKPLFQVFSVSRPIREN